MNYRGRLQDNGRTRDPDIEKQVPKNGVGIRLVKQRSIKEILHPERKFLRRWNMIFLVSCVIAVSADPLFLYIPVINADYKCLALEKTLKMIAICLRSVTDLISVANIILQFLCPFIDQKAPRQPYIVKDTRQITKRYLSSYFVIDILAILPIPQVLVPIIVSEMRGSKFLNTRKILNAVVFSQYVPRFLPIYLSWKEVNKKFTSSHPKSVIRMEAAFNLFLYIVASHVLGAFWYFFSIEREMACWHLACENRIGCNRSSFNCDHGFGNSTFLNDYCPVQTPNTTLFDFGIFIEALQSATVASTDFPRKILNCFWWGLRNLSSFGQNLQTSPDAWENCFTISISIIGMLLFLYFIGNLQVPILRTQSVKQMHSICENLKHVYYSQDSYIIREGEPLDRMLFITKGVVWKFTTSNGGGTVSPSGDCIEEGSYSGNEILEWRFNGSPTPNLSHLPSSDSTLKTHTNVEAFVLMAKDLKALASWWNAEPLDPSQAEAIIRKAWRNRSQVRNWRLGAITDRPTPNMLPRNYSSTVTEEDRSIKPKEGYAT